MRLLYAVPVPDSPPPSQRIADDLREQIVSGRITPGQRMPSNRELVERYSTTPSTVTKAFGMLRTAGLIETRAGTGSYALDPATAHLDDLGDLRRELAELRLTVRAMDAKLDRLLRLAGQDTDAAEGQ